MALQEYFIILLPLSSAQLAAQSEPATAIIIVIIIILIRINDLSKYCAEDSRVFCCKAAKKAAHC